LQNAGEFNIINLIDRKEDVPMKKRTVVLLVAIMAIIVSAPAFGADQDIAIPADILIVRPVSLAATVVGTVIFIVSLPFSIPSGSVEPAAQALIVEPFKYTFTRPIGGFSEIRETAKTPEEK
jgi:hypothetical protein